ncbi:MAG: AAA family ATPase [Thermoplasmata archaeon]|nr:AAA family ATPase [Thermoplasmata archaeon]
MPTRTNDAATAGAAPARSADQSAVAMLAALQKSVGEEVIGMEAAVRLLAIALVSEGHVLLEGVPGLAKTFLVRRFASTLALSFKRIQFTPDMLPSDIVGNVVLSPSTQSYEFRKGPVFANVVLADEINRAPPKVQSALLEAMQERQVTVDGTTYPLPRPFLVIATENPVEQEGTYPLPEAELDRLLFRVILGYPTEEAEVEILRTHGSQLPNAPATSPLTAEMLLTQRDRALQLKMGDDVLRYVASVIRWTRNDPRVLIGASPRAGVQFVRAAKASALLDGRDFVTPEDVKSLAFWILNHRLMLHPEVITQQYTAGRSGLEAVLREIVGDGLSKSTVPR